MEAISGENLARSLGALAQWQRIGGTAGEHEACEYILSRLRAWGIACRAESYTAELSTPVAASVSVEGMDGAFGALPRSFSAPCPGGVTAPLFWDVHAHDALGANEERAWYAAARGRIVIGENFYEDYVDKLRRYGVKGLVHVWTTDEPVLHYETVSPVWGTAEPDGAQRYPDFPVVGLCRADGLAILAQLTPGACERTATVTSEIDCRCAEIRVPVAEIPGETDSYVLIGNHYDSWEYGVTDNATGNAAALEAARILAQGPRAKRGVKIAWWPAHSNGRYAGSTRYCDAHFDDLDAHCVALINMDSPGCRGARKIGFSTSGVVSDYLLPFIRRHTQQTQAVIRPLGRGSDLSFFGPRVPIQVSFDFYQEAPNRGRWDCPGCGGGWWWHSAQDTADKADLGFLARDTAVLAELADALRRAEHLPFDACACGEAMAQTVEDIRAHCDEAFDFAPVLRALDGVRRAMDGLTCFSGDAQAKEAGGRLTRLLCSACDAYHFDSTFAVGRLPGLQTARGAYRADMTEREFLHIETAFRRQANRFAAECRSIAAALGGAGEN